MLENDAFPVESDEQLEFVFYHMNLENLHIKIGIKNVLLIKIPRIILWKAHISEYISRFMCTLGHVRYQVMCSHKNKSANPD